jgi:hypothetical protein
MSENVNTLVVHRKTEPFGLEFQVVLMIMTMEPRRLQHDGHVAFLRCQLVKWAFGH